MRKFLGVALTAFALLVGAAVPASAAELMRVTFVRHGQSAGNASGLIDTSTPGPVLTPLGQQQSAAVVGKLGVNNYDGIYASTMVRTQLTAGPMSQYLRLPTQVLPGLQEIEAGVFEGTPESQAANGYARFPLGWVFQGNRDLRIPGSINGHEFDARVDGALKTVYDSGDRNAIVFSHGGAIMFWTMMNATNLTMEQKLDLLRNHPLSNTNFVVLEGNPEDGWTVLNWNGQQLSAEPTLGAEVQLQARTLTRQLAAAAKRVIDAFATLNPATILAAITQGFADATFSVAKFAGAVSTKVVQELDKLGAADSATQSVENGATLRTAADTVTATTPAITPTARAATNTVTGDTTPADPTPSAAPKPEPVVAKESAEPGVAPNGATDLTDGNKTVPGTNSAEPSGDTSGESDTTDETPTVDADADTDADTDGSEAAEGGSQPAAA